MRSLFLVAIIASAAFMAGWFTISRDDEHTTIKFNRDEIRKDAKTALDRGRQILNKQGQPAAVSGDDARYTAGPNQVQQPYPSQYAPEPTRYPGDASPWQTTPPSNFQDRGGYQNRSVNNPPANWNGQQTPYRPASTGRPQPTRWQQPPENSDGPYPPAARGYGVPRQY